MKKIIVIVMVLSMLMCAAFAEEYQPSHTMFDLNFGCSAAEYAAATAMFGHTMTAAGNEMSVVLDASMQYIDMPATFTARFVDDKLVQVNIDFQTYYSESDVNATCAVGLGFFKKEYDTIVATWGAPDAAYIETTSFTNNIDGVPEASLISAAATMGSVRLRYIWDNATLSATIYKLPQKYCFAHSMLLSSEPQT